jgi:type I restriction enzyme M protein
VKANVLFFDKKPPGGEPWTKEVWIYDFRTNQRLTLKQNPLRREHLDDFVASTGGTPRHEREETERFRRFAYADLLKRDRLNLDLAWLKDDSLEDVSNLPPPDVIAAEIVENLEAALAQFRRWPRPSRGRTCPRRWPTDARRSRRLSCRLPTREH